MKSDRTAPRANVLPFNYRDDLNQRLQDPDFAEAYEAAHERASLGLRIATLRASRGMTQAELAARVNTTQSVISRYESADYVNYRLETLRRLAHALGGELRVDIDMSEETPSR